MLVITVAAQLQPPPSCYHKNDDFGYTLSTTGCHSSPTYHIWRESVHPRRRNDTLMRSKMAAAAILNFVLVTFLVTCSYLRRHCAPRLKIWAKYLHPGRSYGYFSKIKMAADAILFLQKWRCCPCFYDRLPFCTSTQNLTRIRLSTVSTWHFD